MSALFSAEDRAFLRRPHVARCWFGAFHLMDRVWRLHQGWGEVTIGGYVWMGCSTPAGGQLVSVSAVEDPRFGQAAKVDIVLSGVSVEFLRSVKDNARELEGRVADLWWCAFDQETQQVWPSGLKPMFPGYVSSPSIKWSGLASRIVTFSVESLWHSQNYPFGGRWTPADQERRYPGDKGFQYVGVKVNEVLKP